MGVTLKKGTKVSLSKAAQVEGISKLEHVAVGLGWDCNKGTSGNDFDLDAWALSIEGDNIKKKNLVYFGNTANSGNTIVHMGDNLTGEGDGDDETIQIHLNKLSASVTKILIGVNIYKAASRKQSFADVQNAFIRIYDVKTSKEICICKDKLSNELGDYASALFGVLQRIGATDEWEFVAINAGSKLWQMNEVLNVYKAYAFKNIEATNINTSNGGKKVMAVSLSKGGKVSLAKVAADAGISGGLTKIIVGLGWDANKYDGGADFDLDASAFCCGGNGKVTCDEDFVFYNNKVRPGVEHQGDNRTGDGEGDDEVINVDLTAIPANIERVNFTVTIDQADVRNQNFGQVSNAYIRIVDAASGTELIRYDLGEDFSVETAIVVAELYRYNGEWKFNAIGSGFSGGLAALCNNFGVNI